MLLSMLQSMYLRLEKAAPHQKQEFEEPHYNSTTQ